MDKKSKELIAGQYSELIDQFGCDMRSLHNPKSRYTREQQNYKFSIVEKFVEKNDSVLDVGCGLGDLYVYLKGKEWEGAYTGLDISDKMTNFSKKRFPNESFYNIDMSEDDLEGTYDNVICVSTLQQKPAYDNASEYLKRMIEKMFNIAQKTVIFDIFSNRFSAIEM